MHVVQSVATEMLIILQIIILEVIKNDFNFRVIFW